MQGILTKVRKGREKGLQVGLGSRVGKVERDMGLGHVKLRGYGSLGGAIHPVDQ